MNALKRYRIRELSAKVESAFADVTYPGDENIVGCDAQHLSECPECQETLSFFRGKHWRDLLKPGSRIPYGYADWTFLSPEAWHFFLPAHLIAGMDYYRCDVGHSVVFHLTPRGDETDSDSYFWERAGRLSAQQREAIRVFFEFLRTYYAREFPEDVPGLALTTFWQA